MKNQCTEQHYVKREDLPKQLNIESSSVAGVVFLGLALGLLALGVGSFIFAPDVIYFTEDLTLWQRAYMAPGPVTTLGGALLFISNYFNSHAFNAAKEQALSCYHLDPSEDFPNDATLVLKEIAGEEGLYLDIASVISEEVSKGAEKSDSLSSPIISS